MKDKIWTIEFKGHTIKVINKLSFFPPKTSELLEIDDVMIKEVKGSMFRLNSTIFTRYDFSGKEHEVEARIAQKTGSNSTGCQVFIDGEFIGGDECIQYPDPKKIEEQLEKGFLRYFVTTGILTFGLPFGIIMAVINKSDPLLTMAWKFVFHAAFFGLAMSYFTWRGFKSRRESRDSA